MNKLVEIIIKKYLLNEKENIFNILPLFKEEIYKMIDYLVEEAKSYLKLYIDKMIEEGIWENKDEY